MSDSIKAEGESTEEAIDTALEELGVGPEEVEIEVIEKENKGLLGLRKNKAVVKVTVKSVESVARTVVEEIVEILDIPVTVESHRRDDDELWITISGESLAWMIGHHGRTLDALQVIVGSITNKRLKASTRVTVDIEDYRLNRKKEVQALAERIIGKVIGEQKPIALRPMSAMERKTVHKVVGQYEGISSISEGFDPERYVIISPTED